jgi:hypothetical protein
LRVDKLEWLKRLERLERFESCEGRLLIDLYRYLARFVYVRYIGTYTANACMYAS